jgi:CMP-N-acetylneuraminic acid synthetase
MDERFKWANRQELPVYYHPTPVVTISRWQTFLEQRTFLHDRTYALEVDSLEGRDIDTPTDFVLLQTLLNLGISDEPALKVLVNG